MVAVAAGIVLRASSVPEERLLKRFKGQLTIMLTVFLQTLTAQWVANWLQMTFHGAIGTVIVGCNR